MTTVNNSNIPIITCAILAALTTGGPVYAFGLYGASLKENLHLTQSQLDTLSSANFCAGLITWIPGLLVDRYGVRSSMTLGGLCNAAFSLLYWAVAEQVLELPFHMILPTLCACGICLSLANGLVIGSIYKILVCSCDSTTKGTAVGVAKGYVGLGSGVYACLFQAVKASGILNVQSDLAFLPMAAALAIVACALPAVILLPVQEEMARLWSIPVKDIDKTTGRHFGLVYAGLVCLGVMIMGTSLGELFSSSSSEVVDDDTTRDTPTDGSHRHVILSGLVILALWFGPILGLLWIPNTTHADLEETAQADLEVQLTSSADGANEQASLLQNIAVDSIHPQSKDSEPIVAVGHCEDTDIVDSEEHHDYANDADRNYTLVELLHTGHAWLLLWISIVLVGSGTMLTNNMGQMVESLSLLPQETVTSASLAIFSVAQATSRVATGALSDYALASASMKIPRPAFLILACIIGAIAHTGLATTQSNQEFQFIVSVAGSGVAFGMVWPLMVLLVGEIFGGANMATNYLFYDGTASAMGTLLLSKYVTQAVYESHIDDGNDSTTCIGTDCFQMSNWVVVVLAVSAAVAAGRLVQKTKHMYISHR